MFGYSTFCKILFFVKTHSHVTLFKSHIDVYNKFETRELNYEGIHHEDKYQVSRHYSDYLQNFIF